MKSLMRMLSVGSPFGRRPASGASGLQVHHASVVLEGLVFEGGAHGVRATDADGLVIRNCVVVGSTSDGIAVLDTAGVVIEGSRAISSGGAGILLERTSGAYLRSNLVYDSESWGIELDNSNPSNPQPPVSANCARSFSITSTRRVAPSTVMPAFSVTSSRL